MDIGAVQSFEDLLSQYKAKVEEYVAKDFCGASKSKNLVEQIDILRVQTATALKDRVASLTDDERAIYLSSQSPNNANFLFILDLRANASDFKETQSRFEESRSAVQAMDALYKDSMAKGAKDYCALKR